MLWRMLRQSWGRNLRRKVLAIITVFLASSLISALLAVSIDIGDKMSRELKSYGANILIEPAGQAALPALFSESSNPLSGQDFLDEAELPNIKDIFWRNNIVGFAPMLGGEASVEGEPVRILGTFFSQPVDIPDEEGYETGQKTVSPYWQVTGDWPQEPAGAEPQTLVGHALARQMGWKPGDKLTLRTEGEAVQVTVSGILSSGGDEDNQLVMPLSTVQHLLGLPGKVQAIRVSALTVPAALGAFECSVPQHLRKVCFSGSVMPCSCLRQWQLALPQARFVNQYGPTEATASCTYYVVPGLVADTDVLPIGKPYPHYEVFLLSEQNEAVPDGEIGEICVKGPILALGYYNSREKTAESFLQNPLNHAYDERIYKTGDLGHFAPDGNLMFHGRKDRQVKHLGHRVELGEIDLAAAKVSGVEEACALYDQEHEQIWLFYTGADVTKRDIAVALRADLPGFMVPRKIEQLDAMPRLDNGKTDMRALAGRIADAHR